MAPAAWDRGVPEKDFGGDTLAPVCSPEREAKSAKRRSGRGTKGDAEEAKPATG